MKFNIFLISLVFISIGSILLCYHAFDAEPNEPNVLVWDDNDPNDRKIKYDIDDGMYEVVVAEPNDIAFGYESGYFKPNDPNMVDWSYSTEIDPNLVVEYSPYTNSVMFYLDNKEWATFKIKRDGVVGCNVSQAEFLILFPRCLYSCMGELDPNESIVIEWKNEVKE